MQIITSTQNSLIKQLYTYKDNQQDIILVEGIKTIKEAIKNKYEIVNILVTQEKFNEYQDFDFNNYDTYIVSEHIIKHLADTRTPQGIIASIKFEDKVLQSPKHNFLVLDNLQDPGNMGTIIRTALGADYIDLYLINCVNYKSPKVLRSTMGAIFGVNIYKLNYNDLEKLIKENNLQLICTNLNGTKIYDFDVPNGLYGLAIGNEGKGISKQVLQLSKYEITIPMNEKLESLNAGVSAGIAMYLLNYKKGEK